MINQEDQVIEQDQEEVIELAENLKKGVPMATPVFDGARLDEIEEQLKKALEFANYRQTFSIQKKALKEKIDAKANRILKHEYFFKNAKNNSLFDEFVSELNGIFLKIMVKLNKYYFGGFS